MLAPTTLIDTQLGGIPITKLFYNAPVNSPKGTIYVNSIKYIKVQRTFALEFEGFSVLFCNQFFYSDGESIAGMYLRKGDIVDTKHGPIKVLDIKLIADFRRYCAIIFNAPETDFYLYNGIIARNEI